MLSKHKLQIEVIDRARDFVDCFDGFDHVFESPTYMAWKHLCDSLAELDSPEPPHPEPKKGSVRARILDQLTIVEHQGFLGLTCGELEHRLREPHQTVSAALTYLCKVGFIADSGLKRTTASNKRAAVWLLTKPSLDLQESTS